jgi:hypothetical protein
MRSMQAPDFNNCRHDLSRYPHTAHSLVSSDLVGYDTEKWRERNESATGSGFKKLRDGMDLVA